MGFNFRNYWSRFVFTALGLQNSTPIAFLTLRFFIAFFIFLIIATIMKVEWPNSFKEFIHISTAGMLTVGVFSIGVFLSIDFGVSASLSALIIALQPIIVTFLAVKFLGEKLNNRIIWGLILGIIGVAFVASTKASFSTNDLLGVIFSIIALLGLSFGNIYQKKFCANMNLFSGGSIHPKDALKEAARILIQHFMLFSDEKITIDADDKFGNEEFDEEVLHMRQLLKSRLVDLDLSVRALNCLKAADVETLGELVQFNKNDLLKFRNFGKKSLTELDELLENYNLQFGMDISKYKLDKE